MFLTKKFFVNNFYNKELNMFSKKLNVFYFLGRSYNLLFKTKLGFILSQIFGISLKRCLLMFCNFLLCSYNRFIFLINRQKFLALQDKLLNLFLNIELKNFFVKNLKNKQMLRLYQGFRLSYQLPMRGQRSKTNAQSIKKNKFLVSFKVVDKYENTTFLKKKGKKHKIIPLVLKKRHNYKKKK